MYKLSIGSKFTNVHMPDTSFEILLINPLANQLRVEISPLAKGRFPWQEVRNLQHSQRAFEVGEYRIAEDPAPSKEALPLQDVKKIIPKGSYFVGQCGNCGYKCSSEEWDGAGQIADTGDYGDPLCPMCGSKDVDEADDDIYIDQREMLVALIKKQNVSLMDRDIDLYNLRAEIDNLKTRLSSLSPRVKTGVEEDRQELRSALRDAYTDGRVDEKNGAPPPTESDFDKWFDINYPVSPSNESKEPRELDRVIESVAGDCPKREEAPIPGAKQLGGKQEEKQPWRNPSLPRVENYDDDGAVDQWRQRYLQLAEQNIEMHVAYERAQELEKELAELRKNFSLQTDNFLTQTDNALLLIDQREAVQKELAELRERFNTLADTAKILSKNGKLLIKAREDLKSEIESLVESVESWESKYHKAEEELTQARAQIEGLTTERDAYRKTIADLRSLKGPGIVDATNIFEEMDFLLAKYPK